MQDLVKRVFSCSRKFSDYKHDIEGFKYTKPSITPKEFGDRFSTNTFMVPSDAIALDLLTDSGNNLLTKEQIELAQKYRDLVPSIEIFNYARPTPREHLELVFRECFGEQFNYYPVL